MRYIGRKNALLEFIEKPLIENNITSGVFCDIFSGTTAVAQYFKKKKFKIISNDYMYFSYVFQKAYIENNSEPNYSDLSKIISNPNLQKVLDYLNNIKGEKGFIYKNFCVKGSKNSEFERNYFSAENAMKIDAIRETIELWKNKKKITETEFYILLTTLIEAVPFVSNISGTYGAFLKIDDPRMSKPIFLKFPKLLDCNKSHKVFFDDSNELIKKIKCDILYIDPPYNKRQYPANYHMLETIAVWDKKLLDIKTGLRPWSNQKSKYCSTVKCVDVFEDLINNADCKYILFSYNTEGIIPYDEIMRILSNKGQVQVCKQDYLRFKSNSRKTDAKKFLHELLFFVKVK
jgi:adenine-specific DNA-methyltransferase